MYCEKVDLVSYINIDGMILLITHNIWLQLNLGVVKNSRNAISQVRS